MFSSLLFSFFLSFFFLLFSFFFFFLIFHAVLIRHYHRSEAWQRPTIRWTSGPADRTDGTARAKSKTSDHDPLVNLAMNNKIICTKVNGIRYYSTIVLYSFPFNESDMTIHYTRRGLIAFFFFFFTTCLHIRKEEF